MHTLCEWERHGAFAVGVRCAFTRGQAQAVTWVGAVLSRTTRSRLVLDASFSLCTLLLVSDCMENSA